MLLGDDNTSFFYAKMSCKRSQNYGTGILDTNGHTAFSYDEFISDAIRYYQRIFNQNHQVIFPKIICKKIVTEYGLNYLNDNFDISEVKDAIFSVSDDTAPGLDGYNAKLYKSNWNIMSQLIAEAVNGYFNSGRI